jgi:hypothetical protein
MRCARRTFGGVLVNASIATPRESSRSARFSVAMSFHTLTSPNSVTMLAVKALGLVSGENLVLP